MAKDIQDKDTHDAFITFEQLERENFITNALVTGGHYQAVKPDKYYQVTGNRYAGSKTPDVVRDLWATPREVVEYMESRYGKYDLDAAASENNKVCDKFYSKETNCLKRWWGSKSTFGSILHTATQRRLLKRQSSRWSTKTRSIYCFPLITQPPGLLRRRKTQRKLSGLLARFGRRKGSSMPEPGG